MATSSRRIVEAEHVYCEVRPTYSENTHVTNPNCRAAYGPALDVRRKCGIKLSHGSMWGDDAHCREGRGSRPYENIITVDSGLHVQTVSGIRIQQICLTGPLYTPQRLDVSRNRS